MSTHTGLEQSVLWAKKSRSREVQRTAADLHRRHTLRRRLQHAAAETALYLAERHCLSDDDAGSIMDDLALISVGIDLVLIEGLDAYCDAVPVRHRGGAIIAQSADACSQLADAIGKPDLEATVGSTSDGKTTGDLSFLLGFERDGSLRQPARRGAIPT